MQILILGASGRTGKLILSDALSRSHLVTALVRNPSSLSPAPGLTIITGSPLNSDSLTTAMKASTTVPDAVIIALASVRETESPFSKPTSPPRLMTETHSVVLHAMKEFGIKRLITISAFGVGDSNAQVFWPMRMVLNHSSIAYAYEDHNAVENLVRKTAAEAEEESIGKGEVTDNIWKLQWTLVRPAMLSDGARTEVKVLGNVGQGAGMLPSVSRESVADFAVRRCLEKGEFVGETPVICE